jgi:short chain dehydrogenase
MKKEWTIREIPSQTGKMAVVTGANSGIGWHTALELARTGGEVILAARSEEKGRDAYGPWKAYCQSKVADLMLCWSWNDGATQPEFGCSAMRLAPGMPVRIFKPAGLAESKT